MSETRFPEPICFANEQDIMSYLEPPRVGRYIPVVYEVPLHTKDQLEYYARDRAIQSLERLKGEILSHLEQIFPYDHYDHGKIFAYEDVVGMINEDIKELE